VWIRTRRVSRPKFQLRYVVCDVEIHIGERKKMKTTLAVPTVSGMLLACSMLLYSAHRAHRTTAPVADAGSSMRASAWELFTQWSQTDGTGYTRWEHWSTKCGKLQLSRWCPTASGAQLLERTRQTSIHESEAISVPGQFSTVYYNDDVESWISANKLNDSTYLRQMMTPDRGTDPGSRLDIKTQFPKGTPDHAPDSSIVVKEIWEAVQKDEKGNWGLKVYDPIDFRNGESADFQLQSSLGALIGWKRQVILLSQSGTLDSKTPCSQARLPLKRSDTVLIPPGTPPGNPVPVNCFFYRSDEHACSNLVTPKQPMAIQNPATVVEDQPCVLVLVGVQLITRDKLQNWKWSTFWWTADPAGTGVDYSADKGSSAISSVFQNFAMDTMVGMDGDPSSQTPPALFNPYLEGLQPTGTHSNCLQCHALAAYVPQELRVATSCKAVPPTGPRNGLDFFTIDSKPQLARNCTAQELKSPVENHCALRTNLLWSLSSNQDCSSDSPN